MKTVITLAVVIVSTVSGNAQHLEKSDTPTTTVSSSSASVTIDRDGHKQAHMIQVKDGSRFSLNLESSSGRNVESKTWLGVVLGELAPAVASQLPLDPGTGLIAEHVTPESPAAKAGLQKHDVLVRLGDQVLIAPKQLQTLVANRKAGDTIEIAFLRKGQPQTVTATLATHQPGDGLADHEATINLHGTRIDLDRLIKDAHDTAGSIILNKKTVFVGPDGKPVTIDSDEIRERTLKMLENSGLGGEIIEQVKRAFSEAQEQVRKAEEQGRRAADEARKAKEQAKAAGLRAVQELQRNLERTSEDEQPKPRR